MDSFDILVIILSITLAVFLLLAIAATIMFIILLKKVNKATDSAKQAVENVEAITGSMKNVANGSAFVAVASALFDKMKRTKNKED